MIGSLVVGLIGGSLIVLAYRRGRTVGLEEGYEEGFGLGHRLGWEYGWEEGYHTGKDDR